MNNKMILAIVVIAILVWYFFLRKDKESGYTNYQLDGGMLESGYLRAKCPPGTFPCTKGCCIETSTSNYTKSTGMSGGCDPLKCYQMCYEAGTTGGCDKGGCFCYTKA